MADTTSNKHSHVTVSVNLDSPRRASAHACGEAGTLSTLRWEDLPTVDTGLDKIEEKSRAEASLHAFITLFPDWERNRTSSFRLLLC